MNSRQKTSLPKKKKSKNISSFFSCKDSLPIYQIMKAIYANGKPVLKRIDFVQPRYHFFLSHKSSKSFCEMIEPREIDQNSCPYSSCAAKDILVVAALDQENNTLMPFLTTVQLRDLTDLKHPTSIRRQKAYLEFLFISRLSRCSIANMLTGLLLLRARALGDSI